MEGYTVGRREERKITVIVRFESLVSRRNPRPDCAEENGSDESRTSLYAFNIHTDQTLSEQPIIRVATDKCDASNASGYSEIPRAPDSDLSLQILLENSSINKSIFCNLTTLSETIVPAYVSK